MNPQQMKNEAVLALEDIKARDIEVLDVNRMTSLCDYMIIASAESTRQTKALARNVENHLREKGVAIQGVEGERGGAGSAGAGDRHDERECGGEGAAWDTERDRGV